MAPRHPSAGAKTSQRLFIGRWRLYIVALVLRYRRAGASALTTFSRWRTGVAALVHVGNVALRATRTRAQLHWIF
jgi:hypothetical protein